MIIRGGIASLFVLSVFILGREEEEGEEGEGEGVIESAKLVGGGLRGGGGPGEVASWIEGD